MTELPGGLHGAHRRSDAEAHLGRYGLRVALAGGLLHAPWWGVVVDARRALDVRTRAAAATLALGPDAVVCGLTAAELWGCGAAAMPATHVMVPTSSTARRRRGLVVHRGGHDEDVVHVGDLPVLVLDRVLADLLCDGRTTPRVALGIADQALLQAEDDGPQLRKRVATRLDTRADRRGTRRAAGLLDLATGRARSPAESHLLLVLVELGLPRPMVNWPVVSPWGRTLRELDLAWPELMIAVEYQGYAVHEGREAEDEARAEDLRRRGWIVVFADAADLRDPRALEARLRAAFARRGHVW